MEWQKVSDVKTPVGARPGFNDGRYFSLPSVEVKARVQSKYNVPTNKFYSMNYVDREEIEKKDYHTLLDILYQMPGVEVIHNYRDDGMKQREWTIRSRRGSSTLGGSNELLFLLDGSRFYEVDNNVQMSAFEIESVELLQAWQANAYVSGAINGALSIRTRNVHGGDTVRPKGVRYMPIGLFPLQKKASRGVLDWTADKIGRYRIVVDVIGKDDVHSYVERFNVVE